MHPTGDGKFTIGLIQMSRPDYPESEGGDGSGYKIGVGYTSSYNLAVRIPRAEPIPLSSERLAGLLDKDHTNTSFQRSLWELALPAQKGTHLNPLTYP
jgi:hypothetical protein